MAAALGKSAGLRLVLVALLALALAVACGGDEPEPTATSPAGNGNGGDGCETDSDGIVVQADGQSNDDYIQCLYEAAQEEGTVNYYHSASQEEIEAIQGNFEEEFPLVEFREIQATSGVILERALLECRSGDVEADVYGGAAGDQAALDAEDCIEEYRPVNEENVPDEFIFEGEPYITIGYLSFHVSWNTDLISEEEIPGTWEGFLDERWATGQDGPQIAIDLAGFEWYCGVTSYMDEQQGDGAGMEFMEQLAQHEPRLVDGSTLRTELLSAGEFPVALDLYGHRLREFIDEGNPLAVKGDDSTGSASHPEPIPTVLDMSSIPVGAPHPNAARLLQEFFLTPPGQEVFTMQEKATVVEGAGHPYPEFLDGETLYPMGPTDVDFEQCNQEFTDLFVSGAGGAL